MKKTALNETHRNQGGKMVEFAGYDMPVQYTLGMLKEHEWVRSGKVGLFDVSHMGQFLMEGQGTAEFLSHITPTDFTLSTNHLAKYSVLTNEEGGIIDDLIITKLSDNQFFIVLNAACKEKDVAWIQQHLPQNITFTELSDRSLIAVQGAKAEEILNQFVSNANLADLPYMNTKYFTLNNGQEVLIGRTGYTGEDGFEISILNKAATELWTNLCQLDDVKPIGLGARDSLRLEAGYPLYGHDLDDTTSPIEAAIGWVVSKTSKNFIGSHRVLKEKENGCLRKRRGVKLLERGIAREGTEIRKDGKKVGFLSSGGFSPNLKTSIGQGYFNVADVAMGDKVMAVVREREIPAIIESFAFIAPNTKSIKK